MKTRKRKIFTGQEFDVPQHIVRLDKPGTHGWQMRYGTWLYFADHTNDGSGAEKSLREATNELDKRISSLPAPSHLRTDVLKNKKSDLPLGISGPIPCLRIGRTIPYYNFQVSVPVPYGRATNKNVYIGTENTITDERIAHALEKAIAIRDQAVRCAKDAHTQTKREQLHAVRGEKLRGAA